MKYSIVNSHIGVQGWMVEDLHLRGNKLLIFAIIWGFTGNLKSNKRLEEWTVNYRYIESWTGLGEDAVDVILVELSDSGFITIENCTVRVTSEYEL